MAKRTIKHASFSYRVEKPDPIRPGEVILAERKAGRGETVDIPFEEDIQRGERFGAFVEPSSKDGGTVEEVTSVSALDDEELMLWIREDHPKVSEVIDAAEGDPDLARRLLAAEDAATGGDSRRGVVEGLTAVLRRA